MLLQIGKESRLEKDPSIRIKIKKPNLPLDTDGLASWTRKNCGAITSFTEVEQANTFLKKVGKGTRIVTTLTSCPFSETA